MVKSRTIQARIHKDLAKFILRVRGENMRLGHNVTTAKITQNIAKTLNIRDFIIKKR